MFPVALVQLLIMVLVIGVLLWGLSQIPMDPAIKQIVRVIIIVIVAIWAIYVIAELIGAGGYPLTPYPRR